MDDSKKLVDGWSEAKFTICPYIIYHSISSKSITLIEDKFRAQWEAAVTTNDVVQRDKEAARRKRFDVSLQKSKTLDAFVKDIQEIDKLIVSVGLTFPRYHVIITQFKYDT